MKMKLEDATRVMSLCRQVRQTTDEAERIKLVVAIHAEWDKVSEPMLYAAEDAVYFGLFGIERKWATPLDDLPALASAEAEVYVPPEDPTGP
ncbi:MAG: hypothetical protein ABSH34_21655 [Verrucomicrobiota bacterium]|jgi:hypothetical protein